MDERARVILDRILTKTPAELLPHERTFLKARKTYLKPHQKEEFKDILIEKKPRVYVAKKDRK